MREETRMNFPLPVRISGMDADGRDFDNAACSLDISAGGARISGIERPLVAGAIVTVHRGPYQANYRVVWSSEEQGSGRGEVGVRLTDHGSFIWGLVLRRQLGEIDGLPEYVLPSATGADSPDSGTRADASH